MKDRKYVDLGTTGLMLNIITPLQKFSKGGITLTDVLKQRYQDLHHSSIPGELGGKIEEYFTNKKVNKNNKFCLHFTNIFYNRTRLNYNECV